MSLRRDVRYQVKCPVAFVVDGKTWPGHDVQSFSGRLRD